MRQVSYAGQTFVTTDEMASALVDFAAAMASNAASEAVGVPAVDDHWVPITIDIVVGPSIEVISVPFDGGDTQLDTDAAVADLHRRTETLGAEKRAEALPLTEPLPSMEDEL